ncbi:MAG: hypothetical protein ABIN67_02080 [Ferruginibacter sp.]
MSYINKLLKPFNVQLNRTRSLNSDRASYENTIQRLLHFYQDFYGKSSSDLNRDISGIVFSKDRAMQLHALLSSYFYYTKNYVPLTILFTYSNEQHKRAYEILQKEFQTFPISFVTETDFSNQLKEIINNTKADRLFFMTDDGLFLRHFDMSDCLNFNPLKNIFSLRLGIDMDFCYSHNKKQTVPDFMQIEITGKKYNSWTWKKMTDSPDWIYPLSVDATIFLREEIKIIARQISFKSPNSFEAEMQHYTRIFIERNGICYQDVKYVNVPCNLVQNEFKNVFTGTFTVDELLQKFLAGKRIDWKKLEDVKAREAQLVTFTFI